MWSFYLLPNCVKSSLSRDYLISYICAPDPRIQSKIKEVYAECYRACVQLHSTYLFPSLLLVFRVGSFVMKSKNIEFRHAICNRNMYFCPSPCFMFWHLSGHSGSIFDMHSLYFYIVFKYIYTSYFIINYLCADTNYSLYIVFIDCTINN